MSIGENIVNDANSSDEEVKERANEEPESEIWRSKKLDNDIKEQDKDERRLYAYRVFALIAIWLACVILIVVGAGSGNLHYSDTVMVTLLTTTTANVIGLFAIVNGYLFGTKKTK
jgi:hypothetical protein